jgi:hypothetical protein
LIAREAVRTRGEAGEHTFSAIQGVLQGIECCEGGAADEVLASDGYGYYTNKPPQWGDCRTNGGPYVEFQFCSGGIVSWDDRFAEPIVLEDGTKLASLRQAIAHLAKFIPNAERNLPQVLTASNIMTKAAEQGGPVEFARIATLQAINRVRSDAQRHEMRTSRDGARPTTDREVVIQAIEEAQRILAQYIEPGRRDAVATVKALLDVLDRLEVVAALNRLKAGYGLYVVK